MTWWLLDTSLLVRLANSPDPKHRIALDAIRLLRDAGDALCIAPQCLIEFRAVATRPADANGLGMSPRLAQALAHAFESVFTLLPDTPAIFPAWKALVEKQAIVGKQVHDARLAAVCEVHGVPNLLTFNVRHFQKFPALTAVDPADV